MKRSVSIIGLALVCALSFVGLNKLNEPKGFDPDTIPDVVEHLTGIAWDTAAATVDGEPITAQEYLYWACYTAEMMEYYYGVSDWSDPENAEILDYVKQSALDTAKLYRVVETKAGELDCGLTEENRAGMQADYDSMVETLGGEKEMAEWLLQVGLTKEGFEKVEQTSYLYQNLLASVTDTSPATAEEMADYIAENDILKAKHILLMTKDAATGEALSEEDAAAKKAKAEELLTWLRESEEPLALFDELMLEYSEDTGLEAYPDGYTFGPDQMVAEFEEGTRALAFEEISGIVESDYGYHIILRLDPADEAFAADLGELLGASEGEEKMDALLSDWMANAVVETTEVYDSLDFPAYYSGLKALREEIETQDTAAAEQ